MNFDLTSAIELTASAALLIASLSSAFGRDTAGRIRIAAWLAAWFVLVVILAATRALHYEHGLGTPALGLAVVLPMPGRRPHRIVARVASQRAIAAAHQRANSSRSRRQLRVALRGSPSASTLR